MSDIIILLLVYGVPTALYAWYRHKHPKQPRQQQQFICTADVDATLDRVQELREQLHRLDHLQTELDIANMDNCISKTVSISWGNRDDDNYILQIATEDTSELQKIIDKERIRLTTSLAEELAKIPQPVKSKGNDKTKSYSRGEETAR